MDKEARAAFIKAMTVCAQAEIAAMQVENVLATQAGEKPPHNGQAFRDIPLRYGIHHNAVVEYLRD